MATLDELVTHFRTAAIAKGEEGGPFDLALYEQLRASFRELTTIGPDGRQAFAALLHDPHPTVRLWVAAQLLAEGDEAALPVLHRLAQQEGVGGFNALMTIREHEAGRLKSPFGEAAA